VDIEFFCQKITNQHTIGRRGQLVEGIWIEKVLFQARYLSLKMRYNAPHNAGGKAGFIAGNHLAEHKG